MLMYVITNKSGCKTQLFDNLKLLYDEYKKLSLFYEIIIPDYEEINQQITSKGYYEVKFNDDIYYILQTNINNEQKN